ncbi:hypothetical protein BKA70DRAFT_1087996 [Coprinopsis sp. MPI-PUGE-AT-0042]|nr:hypothetical protein BKA70DRAFT_1087996 [Coprinopsis sp. MPI-PUGE-AT-0042]
MTSYAERELFGGAIVVQTKPSLMDASDVRQVPDTQEVLLYPDSSVSIIVEILQRVEPNESDEAVKFHFNSLAHDNDARRHTVQSISVLPNDRGDRTPSAILLNGEQFVKKFNRSALDTVQIYMALYRVEDKVIDVVVTFNAPTQTEDGGAVGGEQLEGIQRDFDAFVRSFQIKDFGLFA